MSSVISTNITSMIAQQNLNSSKSDLTTAMERLSSGMRINSAKDDAAGQAIANRMSSQITGLSQAQRNANDGISVAQTTEGALNQVNDNLQRIRELTVQAQNGTNSADDLESIQNEIGQRLNEINRVSEETSFNGVKVLQEDNSLKIQVGANDGETISIDLKQIDAKTLGLTGFNVDGQGETPNTAATKDSLTLAGATQVGTSNEYQIKTDNADAGAMDVLGKMQDGDSITDGTTTYTYDANSDSFSYNTSGNSIDTIKDAMKPAVGETTTASVTIGGKSTDITIANDGSITATGSGNALYLDSTGNLTENGAGSPPAATIDNLAASIASSSGDKIEIDGGATYTASATIADLTDGSGIAQTTASVATSITASASGPPTAVDVKLNGNTSTVQIDDTGAVTDGTNALYLDENNNLTTDTQDAAGNAYTAATATSLANAVGATSGTLTITDANANGASGDSFSGNGREVDATGLSISASGINDTIEQANGSFTATLNTGDAAKEQDITIDSSGASTTVDFAGGTGTDALATGTVQLNADDSSLTDAATTDVSYFAQENGNITNASGQRIYEDGEGGFTTDDVTTGDRTENPLDVLDSALKTVDSLRSDLGAIQNRFDSAITNLSTTETNLSAARSRIEDADYATEVSNMTRAQILQQAGTSVLAQANQVPQSVLSLLG